MGKITGTIIKLQNFLEDKDTDVKLDGRTLARAIDKNKGKLGYAIMG